MTLPIKRLHHLPPHLSYVSKLLDITKKTENLRCLRLNKVSGSEKSRLCVYITVGVKRDVPLPLHMYISRL